MKNVERGVGDHGRHGISAEGVEVSIPRLELQSDLPVRHDGRDGVAIAHRLAHRDDVGANVIGLEAPHVGSRPGEPHLHLVGDRQRAQAVGLVVGEAHVILRRNQCAIGVEDRIHQQCRHGSPSGAQAPGSLRDMSGVAGAEVGVSGAIEATIDIWRRQSLDPVRLVRDVIVEQGKRGENGGVAVVAVPHHRDAASAGDELSHPDRKIVGFRAHADEEPGIQTVRKRRRQPFAQPHGFRMQIARVGAYFFLKYRGAASSILECF